MKRKQFIQHSAAFVAATFLTTTKPLNIFTMENRTPNFQLPALDYAYSALEPIIDTATMEVHYTKHHKGYVDNLNTALSKLDYKNETVEQILGSLNKYNVAVRNNAGGHYNHSLFWKLLVPEKKIASATAIEVAIQKEFASIESFKKLFAEAAPVGLEAAGCGLSKRLTKN